MPADPAGSGAAKAPRIHAPKSPAVVDASALGALLFGEPEGNEIAARLDGRPLLGPTLLRYELASVCLKKSQRHPGLRARLERALELFAELEVQEVQVPVVTLPGTAAAASLSVYDAAYLWLARTLEAELVTLDRQLHAAWRDG